MMHIDLSGTWQVLLDAQKSAVLPTVFPDTIALPGTTAQAKLGQPNDAFETGYLTDAYKFEGYAWFMRPFTSGAWQDQQVLLTLERTRKTTVYLDGNEIGHQESLCTPHRYLLPSLSAGEHTLLIRVDNTDYPTRGGHLTSPDTQSNWNGITGEISLTVAHTLLQDLTLQPDLTRGALHVHGQVIGATSGVAGITLPGQQEHLLPYTNGILSGECPLRGTEELWDEYHPNLHCIQIDLDGDVYEATFGLRDLRRQGRRLLINGEEVFLRGKHDGLLFPLTGAAPTNLDEWLRVLSIAKSYGINHYRYHTSCPPDAAFTAADMLGIYMEPELPFWGTIAEEGEEGYDAAEREFLYQEGLRMLREFGSHPSFIILSLGNELWGSKRVMNQMLHDYRQADPTKFYVCGSNNFQWVPDVLAEDDLFVGVRLSGDRLIRGSYAMCDAPQGIVQTTAPESIRNYDAMIAPETLSSSGNSGKVLIQYGTGVKEVDAESAEAFIPQVPVISHEVGQYEFYPDFSEISHYTGPLQPRNLQFFQQRLMDAGLYDDHERFFRQAGRLAVDCYKRELETFLRTKELSGFQLLDLQDFSGQGTALVGVLNALMESKGLLTPAEWREFCSDTVVLGEFSRFVFSAGEDIIFQVQVSECQASKQHATCTYTILQDGQTLPISGEFALGARTSRLSAPVSVTIPGASLLPYTGTGVTCFTVHLTLPDGTCNHYPIWIFPQENITITRDGIEKDGKRVAFVSSVEEAQSLHTPAIVIPAVNGQLPAEYCTDFWCYPMFRSISESMKKPWPVGTLGLSIDTSSSLLTHFAKEDYTTPAWYTILKVAHCQELPGTTHPTVQMIDNTERCKRLGILYEQDGAICLTARLWENPDDMAIRAFAASLWEHFYA